jgi:hypothetical protein
MKILTKSALAALALSTTLGAQNVNLSQQVVLQGLVSSSSHGSFLAAAYGSNGNLYLLLNESDGLRVLETNAAGTTVLAQTHSGAAGDAGVAMALDASGNIYVTGTTTSGTLTGTAGAAFPAVADTTTNSFVAKYDQNLNLVFLTFLGAGRTAASSVAATSDGVFVTGITFSSAFPVTPAGIQQVPASGSTENGFVSRFSTDGSTLSYATYLTGANGITAPTAIVVDGSDTAYIAGATASSGYPTINAVQPAMLGTNSGFLTALNAAGSAFVYSTYIAGNGITGMALETKTGSLLLTGNVALGEFPVATVAMPLTSASYQTLLRIPLSGQTVTSSVLLVPGTQSYVTADGNGGAWISGALTTPLFPGDVDPDYSAGDSFLLHLTAANVFDQTLRVGGLAVNNASYASLASAVAAAAVNGSTIMLPGTVTATLSSSLLSTQRFDLPFVAGPNSALPNALSDVIPTAAECGSLSQCTGTGALLTEISTATQSTTTLSVSSNDTPNLTLRNMGSVTATGLNIAVSGFTQVNDCGTTLEPSNQCSIALTGVGPGTLTVSAANAASTTVMLPANTLTPDALVLSTYELDYGIVSSVDGVSPQTVKVTNLSGSTQTFTSAKDGGGTTAYSFANTASTCASAGTSGTYTLAANSSCAITLGLTVSSSSANDGPVRATWKIGARDVVLTAYAQAAALNVSATAVNFGTQYQGSTLLLPRYLYLTNNSNSAIAHAAVSLPASSPFTVVDNCPSSLEPNTVCQMKISYLSSVAPSYDTTTLTLDEGTTVTLNGTTQPQTGVSGSSSNPNLNVSVSSITFSTSVPVTGVSSSTQTVMLTNMGSSAFALTLAISGDFTVTSGCPASLSGGASCQVQVGFTPSQPGARTGVLGITAGSSFAPAYVSLSGTGSAILPPNNGTLALGQTLIGEPVVVWYQVQQSLTALTASTSSSLFGVAIVEDTGNGHGTLPASSFAQSATGSCSDCWLGVQFLSPTAGVQGATLTLSTVTGGSPYLLSLLATALPVQGLLLTPISPDFGPVAINSSSAPMLFTLANLLTSSSGVTVTSVTTTGDFTVAANTSGGASCSGNLTSTASCFMDIVFSPTATGDRSGTLTVVTSGGTATAILTGYGEADPGLAINPTALTFTNVPGSAATQQTVLLSNTGTSPLSIGAATASDPSFNVVSTCSTLNAGSMCSLTVTFTPQTANVSATLSFPVTVTLNGQVTTTTYSVPLTGGYTSTGSGLQLLANSVNFGSETTGALGGTREFLLNNLSGQVLNVTISMPRQFPLAAPASCSPLAAGASCSFSVSFLPVTGAEQTGSVYAIGTLPNNAGTVQTLAYMQGYGAASGVLSITGGAIPNTPISFGQVTSGQTASQTLTLTNTGTGPMTVRRITSQPPFYSTSACGQTLAANASCTVMLTYEPIDEITSGTTAYPRTDTGVLTIESDAISSPNSVQLTGTVQPVVSSNPANSSVLASYSLTQSALTFANTQIGDASAAQTITLTNTGTTTIHILSTVAPVDFTSSTSCSTILPGSTCSFSVEFTPTTASSASVRSGTLEILSDAATSLEFVSLIGTTSAAPLMLSPVALNFGTVDVGSNDSLSVSVTNNISSPVVFTGLTASGDYSVGAGSCPANGASLAAGSSCTLSVTFAPTATGTRTGTLSLSNNATQLPLTVSLTGVGAAAQLQVTPGALAFGNVDVTSPSSLTLTLLNTGSASVTGITNAISGANAADFAVTSPCSVASLAPNQGCTETVTFTPSAVGARSASLTVASSDPNGPAVIALSGTGVQGGSFVLTVDGGTSATVVVNSGQPAVYDLLVTPGGGFAGSVALTCTPIVAAQYASCSLLASTLSLSGGTQYSTATINTITGKIKSGYGAMGMVLLLPLALLRRRKLRATSLALLLLVVVTAATISGCGSGPHGNNPGLLYTPPGTYQYQVTASALSGSPQSSTVTLNLIVQ